MSAVSRAEQVPVPVMSQRTEHRRVLIVAGEASGDLHAANLIRAARELAPGLSFFGVGGDRMRAAGCDVRIPMESLSVMGVVEVLGRLPAIRRVYRDLCRMMQPGGDVRPDLLVLVDYPGMNLKLARAARRAGVPVLYYIAPKVWASRPGRMKTMARCIDQLAVIFPFEEELFNAAGIRTAYVGNPLLDEFSGARRDVDLGGRLGFDPQRPIVGLLPGSRRSEIRYCWPTMVEAARALKDERPELQFVVPLAPSLSEDLLREELTPAFPDLMICREDIYSVAGICSAILSVSGTVTLQVALAGIPMTVIYKASSLTYALARRLIRIPYVSLPNIVAGRQVVAEYLQDEANVENLLAELKRLLSDGSCRAEMINDLAEVRRLLGEPGCSRKVAVLLKEMVY
ncbi:lipid-A-disaccharide synthase [Geothermobacter hydrogeniphilus]|uniref:Lipid-A-disaccharide synthase n=2 Tax=Geothermobacter hydrogeniphilus TaxID=1969733 RepID=A0A1X0Y1G7_9BACT|nr:lipid-A-disaccharide synthase [Geothermobacter hydrogeniphilus]